MFVEQGGIHTVHMRVNGLINVALVWANYKEENVLEAKINSL